MLAVSPPPSSSSFSLSSLIGRRRKARGSVDDLAAVKAAAWAWYQHGSGSEGKPMREYDITITRRALRPSRYKQEAVRLRMAEDESDSEVEAEASPVPVPVAVHKENYSLFDSYETQIISTQFLGQLEEPRSSGGSSSSSSSNLVRAQDLSSTASSPESVTSSIKNEEMKKFKRLWRRRAVVCGRREDVVDSAIVFRDSRLLLRQHVPVVGLTNCRPRAARGRNYSARDGS